MRHTNNSFNYFCFIILFSFGISLNAQKTFVEDIYPDLTHLEFVDDNSTLDKNKPVILDFWASWCTACIKSFPHMNDLHEKYKDQIQFVAVNSYDSLQLINTSYKKHNLKVPVAQDKNEYLKTSLQIKLIPAVFLIDTDGRLMWKGAAYLLSEEFIDKFLKDGLIQDFKEYIVQSKGSKSLQITDSVNYSYVLSQPINEELQSSTATLDVNVEDQYHVLFENMPLDAIIQFLLYTMHSEKIYEVKFEGNLPEILSVNFEATSTAKDKKVEISADLLKLLMDEFGFDYSILDDTNVVVNFH